MPEDLKEIAQVLADSPETFDWTAMAEEEEAMKMYESGLLVF